MKLLLLITVYLSSIKILLSQSKVFTIEGNVRNVDSGKIYLVPVVSNEKYYGASFLNDSAIIKGGNFKINRKALDYNTYAYRLVIQSPLQSGVTDFIFISGRSVFVEIDTIAMHFSPRIANSIEQNEMVSEYNPFFSNFVKRLNAFNEYEEELYTQFNNNLPKEKTHEIETTQKQFHLQSDSLFRVYASNHPNSQVTLWKMVERLENLGFNSEYKSIFERLPDKLQNSFIGRRFYTDILEMEVLRNGSVFPAFRFENTMGEILSFDSTLLGKSFTLVDFWFTDCSPCRQQFPEFKRLFSRYKDNGFQIVGISIDGASKLNAWKNIINKEMLVWHQLLDKGGGVTQQLGINAFPTNFMLDRNGEIIKKNITLTELESLLKGMK